MAWKKKEEEHAEKAVRYLKRDFMGLNPAPHDYFNIQPESYNLSIQYDRDKQDAENEKAKKAKKKK